MYWLTPAHGLNFNFAVLANRKITLQQAECYPENQSSAAKCGKEATKKKSKQNDRKKKREKSSKRRKTGEMTGKIA